MVTRRRERSGRVTVVIGLLCLATLTSAVGLALWTEMALGAAALVALLCGCVATRIMHSEARLIWRETARDRAGQAAAFRDLHAQSSSDHLRFAAAMSERLA